MPEQTFRPDQSWREAVEFGARFARGAEALGRIRDADVDVGATPKTQTMRVEKVTLHHYDPLPGVEVKTGPVLIVYGLVGRYTMADLQEDRSLVRNLLKRGVDLWVVDWGNPSRADQFLTIDNYVDWFLDDCVEHIREAAGVDKVTLLGICEGGTFSTFYAARHAGEGREPDPDHHPDRLPRRPRARRPQPRLHQRLDPQPRPTTTSTG